MSFAKVGALVTGGFLLGGYLFTDFNDTEVVEIIKETSLRTYVQACLDFTDRDQAYCYKHGKLYIGKRLSPQEIVCQVTRKRMIFSICQEKLKR